MEDCSRVAILKESGAMAWWMAGPTAACIAAVIVAASSWPAPGAIAVLTGVPRLRVTFGLRLSMAQGAGESFPLG